MMNFSFSAVTAQALKALLGADLQIAAWRAEDLAEILAHQLDTSVATLLADAETVCSSSLIADPGNQTVGQVLLSSSPSRALLIVIKDFAKQIRLQADSTFPEEVATVLYYAAIASAQINGLKPISQLNSEAIQSAMTWLLLQPWIPAELNPLFATAAAAHPTHDGRRDHQAHE